MKKYLILLLVGIMSFSANAQKTPYLSKSFSIQNINAVNAKTSDGNISVTAVNPSESRVEVFVSQKEGALNKLSNDEIKSKITDDYALNISVNNGTLTVIAKSTNTVDNWKNSLSFSFKIYVPARVSTQLKTIGGNIDLTGISGNQDFKTSGGNLSLNSLSGNIKGKTTGGNIMAYNSEGTIKISTSGGSIQLNDLNGNIAVSTSGGNIHGESIKGNLSVGTSGGNVSLEKLACSVKASTSGGNIDVSIEKPGKYVSIHNSGGKVRLTIPKNTGMDLKLNASKISTRNVKNFNGTITKLEMNGTVNGGGIPITVDAGSGKIYLVLD